MHNISEVHWLHLVNSVVRVSRYSRTVNRALITKTCGPLYSFTHANRKQQTRQKYSYKKTTTHYKELNSKDATCTFGKRYARWRWSHARYKCVQGFEEELCWVCDGLRSWVGFSFSSARLHSPVFFLLTGNASVIAIAAAVKQLLLRMHKTPYGMSSMNWRGFAFVLTWKMVVISLLI